MIKRIDIISFIAGLSSVLFIPTPVGRIALFELSSYLLSIIIISRGGFKNFNKIQKRLIIFSLIWFISAIFTDFIRNENQLILIKSSLIVLSVPCVLIVAFSFLKKSKYSFLWYVVGYGISGVMSLYIFHNGAFLFNARINPNIIIYDITPYLIPKQVVPFYIDSIFYSLLFPLSIFYGIPLFLLSIAFGTASTYMLTIGSRLNFLTYGITSILTLGFFFSKKLVKRIFNNSVAILFIMIPILYGIFEFYAYTANKGLLGEGERQKFESQVLDSEYGALGGRESSLETAKYALSHPIIGTGSSAINQDQPHLRISGHSIIFGSWAINGIGGLIFWGYSCLILFKFSNRFYLIDRRRLPFIMLIIFSTYWNIFFSPFGGNRGFLCVVIAYSAIQLINLNQKTISKSLNKN